ncbi:hypothetical protein C0991_003508 [Blastosporella zonata]|nr:hypothetical protein C0991_003508 [Blastosporella zonata]
MSKHCHEPSFDHPSVSVPPTETETSRDERGISFHAGGYECDERELQSQVEQTTPLGGVHDPEFTTIRDDLRELLDKYRGGEKSHGDVVREIVRIVDTSETSQSFKDFAIEHWNNYAFRTKAHVESRAKRGNTLTTGGQSLQVIPPRMHTEPPGDNSPRFISLKPKTIDSRGDELEGSDRPQNTHVEGAEMVQFTANGIRIRKNHPEEPEDEYYEDKGGHKQRRVIEKNMPWFEGSDPNTFDGNPATSATQRILSQLGKNLPESKRFLLNAANLPTGFPHSEWDNVLTGRQVNFDVVFGAIRLVGSG